MTPTVSSKNLANSVSVDVVFSCQGSNSKLRTSANKFTANIVDNVSVEFGCPMSLRSRKASLYGCVLGILGSSTLKKVARVKARWTVASMTALWCRPVAEGKFECESMTGNCPSFIPHLPILPLAVISKWPQQTFVRIVRLYSVQKPREVVRTRILIWHRSSSNDSGVGALSVLSSGAPLLYTAQ